MGCERKRGVTDSEDNEEERRKERGMQRESEREKERELTTSKNIYITCLTYTDNGFRLQFMKVSIFSIDK